MSANKTKSARTETAVKVLLWDCETDPNLGYTWGKWQQNVIRFVRQRQIICFSWKWLNQDRINVKALPSFKMYARFPECNRDLIRFLHTLFSKADVIVAHNGDKFDDKMANTDFIKNGLPPPPPHKTIDTLKIARKHFRFNGNSLDELGEFLGLGRKVKHGGIELWFRCLAGEKKAWEEMKVYNKGDVSLLEKVYYKFRPWMTNHPNMTALDGRPVCPKCRADALIRDRWIILKTGKAMQFHCKSCGGWCRGRKPKLGPWKFS